MLKVVNKRWSPEKGGNLQHMLNSSWECKAPVESIGHKVLKSKINSRAQKTCWSLDEGPGPCGRTSTMSGAAQLPTLKSNRFCMYRAVSEWAVGPPTAPPSASSFSHSCILLSPYNASSSPYSSILLQTFLFFSNSITPQYSCISYTVGFPPSVTPSLCSFIPSCFLILLYSPLSHSYCIVLYIFLLPSTTGSFPQSLLQPPVYLLLSCMADKMRITSYLPPSHLTTLLYILSNYMQPWDTFSIRTCLFS